MPSSKKQLKIDTLTVSWMKWTSWREISTQMVYVTFQILVSRHMLYTSACAHYIQGSLLVWLDGGKEKKRNSDVLF